MDKERKSEGALPWSIRLGTIGGIAIYVHATFLFIIAFVAVQHWQIDGSWSSAVRGALFILAVFGCVVLHELGHALAAKRYGIRTRNITLLPIGGLAQLERMPEKPMQELVVALAGPAVNVIIAIALGVSILLFDAAQEWSTLEIARGSFLERLLVVNLFLIVFNMLPAFPMDGGRALRAILAMRMAYGRATQIAAQLGQGMALLFGLIGIFFNPFLIFIALFVWIGAGQEASATLTRIALEGEPVQNAMITEFQTISPEDALDEVVQVMLRGSQQDFPVMFGDSLIGIVTRNDLINALAKGQLNATAGEIVQRDIPSARPDQILTAVLPLLQQHNTVPVILGGRLVGLLTRENVGEYLMVRTALDRRD